MGVKPPRGILLHGPPGTGKTMMANAIAGSLGVPFITISAPSVVSGMSGESEKKIREVFEEAKELAAWLTAPEQQIKAFEAKGTFPSQVDALDDPALTGSTNAFFNDAPTGEILAARAEAVPFIAHKGPKFADINTAFQQAIQRVDEGQESADEAWDSFLADVERLG